MVGHLPKMYKFLLKVASHLEVDCNFRARGMSSYTEKKKKFTLSPLKWYELDKHTKELVTYIRL